MTLHSQGKNGVNISKKKYNVICDYILQKIHENGVIAVKQLFAGGEKKLKFLMARLVGTM